MDWKEAKPVLSPRGKTHVDIPLRKPKSSSGVVLVKGEAVENPKT